MKTTYYIGICVLVLLTSCSSTSSLNHVTLKKGTPLIKVEDATPNAATVENKFTLAQTVKNAQANITLKETSLKIELFDKNSVNEIVAVNSKQDLIKNDPQYRWLNYYSYSPELKGDDLQTILKPNITIISESEDDNNIFSTSGTLHFTEKYNFFQALTIPFKIRGAEGDFPSQVSTSFNAGLAYGRKWTFHKVKPLYSNETQKMIGYEESKLSFALTPFIGLTPVSLSSANTGGTITKDQSVLGVSFGGAGIISLNQLNIGLALGVDNGIQNSSDWIYQGKLWTGIIIGIDFIK